MSKAERQRVTDTEHRTTVLVDELAGRLVAAVTDYLARHNPHTSTEGMHP